MEYFVKIKKNLGYFEKFKPVYLTPNETISYIFPQEENLVNCIVHFSNGTHKCAIRADLTKPLVLPSDMLLGGELVVSVEVLVKDIVAREITIEPLSIIETEREPMAFPEMAYMDNKIIELSQMLASLKADIAGIKADIENLQSAVEQ